MKQQSHSHTYLHVFRKALHIFIGLLVTVTGPAWGDSSRLIPDYHARGKVWRVFSDGKVQGVFPPPGQNSGEQHAITQIAISPQQRKIAYVQNNDLWVYDLVSQKASRLTTVGKPYTKTLASVEVITEHWSPDENRILYSVIGGDTEDPEGDRPDLKVRPAAYGTYIVELKSGQSKPIRFPAGIGRVTAWLNNGDFLFQTIDNIISRFDPRSGVTTPILKKPLGLGQLDISHDGLQMLATADPSERMRSSLLVQHDLQTGTVAALTPLGKWAEFQRPKFSPGGTRIAYFHITGLGATRHPITEVVIDNKAIYTFEGNGRLFWIDESTVALLVARRQIKLIVLDAGSGAIKVQQDWE
jgi:hypothetical protein